MEAGDAGDDASAAVEAGSGERAVVVGGSVNELDFFVEGHLVDHEVGAGVGVEGGVHPGLLRCGGGHAGFGLAEEGCGKTQG
jgi:hypothetical protein